MRGRGRPAGSGAERRSLELAAAAAVHRRKPSEGGGFIWRAHLHRGGDSRLHVDVDGSHCLNRRRLHGLDRGSWLLVDGSLDWGWGGLRAKRQSGRGLSWGARQQCPDASQARDFLGVFTSTGAETAGCT
jgi:hypothetical protein